MTQYTTSVKVSTNAPKEIKERAVFNTRHEAGVKLYDVLFSQKLPALVDIDEECVLGSNSYNYFDEYIIRINVEPVTHRHVILTRADYDYSSTSKPKSKIERLLDFIRARLK